MKIIIVIGIGIIICAIVGIVKWLEERDEDFDY